MSEVSVGDYVLASKYRDGDPGDQWCVGFLKEVLWQYDPPRYDVVDGEGRSFRGNGFRRIAKITPERGKFILNNIESIANGSRSIWWWKRTSMIDWNTRTGDTK